jgi:hypothetical protein
MKTKLLCIILCFLMASLKAQLPTQRIFGGDSTDAAKSIIETYDFGFLLGGTTNSFGAGAKDIYLIKTDENGDTLWNKTYGSNSDDEFSDIKETSDNGAILIGTTSGFGAVGKNIYVTKVNSLGDIQWSNSYGSANEDVGNSIIQTTSNNYVLTGSTFNTTTNKTDVVIIKFDINGDTLWSKTFGSIRTFGSSTNDHTNDAGLVIKQTSDSNYLILSSSSSVGFGPTFSESMLTKMDTNGNIIWSRRYYMGADEIVFNSVQETFDNGFVLSGTNSFWNNISLMKTNSVGGIEWSNTIGQTYFNNNLEGTFSLQLPDSSFLTLSPSQNHNILIINTDALGSTLWSKEYGTASETIGKMILKNDNQLAVSGSTNSDYYLLFLDSAGNAGCNSISSSTTNNSVQLIIADSIVEIGLGPYSPNHPLGAPFPVIPSVNSFLLNITTASTLSFTQNPIVSAPCFTPQDICLVTTDSLLKKNKIVWEKQFSSSFVKEYNIYKESATLGVYNFLGSIPSDSLSEYIDSTSSPLQNSDRYKISQVNINDFESELGLAHRTIHLSVSPGLSNTINLNWNHYEGTNYNTYRIWRGTESQLTLLDSVNSSINSYTDLSPNISDSIYILEIIPTSGSCVSAKSNTFVSILSNKSSSSGLLTSIEGNHLAKEIKLYPNPVSSELIIENDSLSIMEIEIIDITGKTLFKTKHNTNLVQVGDLPSGIYFIHLITNERIVTKKFVKQ